MKKADALTEQSLISLEKKIKTEYQKAYELMCARYDEYINGSADGETLSLADRIKLEEKAYRNGAYTDKEWEAWKLTQIQRGERYKAMLDDMAKRMSNTNQIASAYINDKTPSIYSINQNYQAYEIGKGKEGVSFTLYDEQTIKNLIEDEDGTFTEFRTVRVDPKRDYEWNRQQIKSAVISGILQGSSIDKITDAFMGVMQRNRSAAIRNARTAYTSAQNGGRIEALTQAQNQGISVRKQWLSAHDGRVRDSHAMLNGQIRDIDKPFDNGLMYPADSKGRPSEVYNCRCTLTYIYPEWDKDESSEIYKSKALNGETFQQFVKRMGKENPEMVEQNKTRYEFSRLLMAGKKGLKKTFIKNDSLQLEKVKQYALDKGIKISNIYEFDGDIDILKEHIDNLEKLKNEFDIEQVKVSFKEDDYEGDLGWTSDSGVIHFIKGTMGNRQDIIDYMGSDDTLSSTDIIGISSHEFGHVLSMTRGEKGFEIAQKAYYNVFNRNASISEMLEYLGTNISSYSTKHKNVKRFDKKDYKEILPEVFGKNSTNPDEFTKEFYRIAKEELL